MRATTNQLFEGILGLSSESESSTLEIANIWKMETAWIERREGLQWGAESRKGVSGRIYILKILFFRIELCFCCCYLNFILFIIWLYCEFSMQDLSPPARDQTLAPFSGILTNWTTRESQNIFPLNGQRKSTRAAMRTKVWSLTELLLMELMVTI